MPLNPTHRTFNIIYSIAFQDSVLLISPILDFSLRCHLLYPTLVYIPVPLNLSPYVCIKPHGLAPHVLYSWDIMWFECYMAEVAVWNGWLIFFSIVLEQPAAAAAAAAWAVQSPSWWKSNETQMGCDPPPPKTRREDNTLREARALERCTGIADYFPGDRWQRLQMTGDRRRCQYISVNYDCNKTQCVWRRGLNKYVSCTSRDIALIIIMAIFLY